MQLHCFFVATLCKRSGKTQIHSRVNPIQGLILCYIQLLQMELCHPGQLGFIEKEIKGPELVNNDCHDACNGIFADIQIEKYYKEPSSDFKSILDEYIRYKENYVQNVEFNSSLDKTSFGE